MPPPHHLLYKVDINYTGISVGFVVIMHTQMPNKQRNSTKCFRVTITVADAKGTEKTTKLTDSEGTVTAVQ